MRDRLSKAFRFLGALVSGILAFMGGVGPDDAVSNYYSWWIKWVGTPPPEWFKSPSVDPWLSAVFGVLANALLIWLFWPRKPQEQNAPKFVGRIYHTITARRDDGATDCFIQMAIKNLGTQSIVDSAGWKVHAVIGGQTHPMNVVTIPNGTILTGEQFNQDIHLSRKDAIYEKTAVNPIQGGGQAVGWICARIYGTTQQELTVAGNHVVVHFKDVRDKSYFADHIFPSYSSTPRYYPDGTGGHQATS
jgi:hypothetical protein